MKMNTLFLSIALLTGFTGARAMDVPADITATATSADLNLASLYTQISVIETALVAQGFLTARSDSAVMDQNRATECLFAMQSSLGITDGDYPEMDDNNSTAPRVRRTNPQITLDAARRILARWNADVTPLVQELVSQSRNARVGVTTRSMAKKDLVEAKAVAELLEIDLS